MRSIPRTLFAANPDLEAIVRGGVGLALKKQS